MGLRRLEGRLGSKKAVWPFQEKRRGFLRKPLAGGGVSPRVGRDGPCLSAASLPQSVGLPWRRPTEPGIFCMSQRCSWSCSHSAAGRVSGHVGAGEGTDGTAGSRPSGVKPESERPHWESRRGAGFWPDAGLFRGTSQWRPRRFGCAGCCATRGARRPVTPAYTRLARSCRKAYRYLLTR